MRRAGGRSISRRRSQGPNPRSAISSPRLIQAPPRGKCSHEGISPYIRRPRKAVGSELLLLPSVTGIIFDERDRILLVRQADSGAWSAPGGVIEPDEIPADAVVREVWEETGLYTLPVRLLGVFGGPHCVVKYPNGDRSAYVMSMFECTIRGGRIRTETEETTAAAYVSSDELRDLPVAPWVRHVLPAMYDRSGGAQFESSRWQPPA